MRLALITPSYAPDRNRCSLLSQSIDRWVDPSIDHIVVVPRRDKAVFHSLPSRSKVITVESILPKFFWQVPVVKKWWLTPCSLPVRGWIMQQIVKLSIGLAIDADVLVFADSDVTFIRPLGSSHIVKEGRVRLHRIPGAGRGPRHLRWNRKAAELLGLPERDYFGYDYIGQLVCWRRENVVQLHRHLETIAGRGWHCILCNTLHFAEYILYGVFVEHVLGEQSGHYFDSEDLCHCSWHYDISNNRQLEDFLKQVKDRHVAVLCQSYLGLSSQNFGQLLQAPCNT